MRKGAHQGGHAERNAIITRSRAYLIVGNANSWSSRARPPTTQPTPVSSADLALIRRIDEQHPQCPFAGARMLSIMMLTREGRTVGLTLMKRIGLHALYRKPNTSKRQLARQVYPYLLCHLEITQSNHV